MAVSTGGFAVVLLVMILAGTINGLTGFGFALIGTMVLASFTDPATAIVIMIIPILAVNSSLITELSIADLQSCGRRFTPLLVAALIGTIIGMAIIDMLPEQHLRLVLGIVTLGFVISAQTVLPIPYLDRARDGCFVESTPAMLGVGGVGGVLFGGTNVGVQLVAYIRSCDLSHQLFIGVIAMVFLGLNGVRVGLAGYLGLYSDVLVLIGSVVAIVPALIGVAIGKQLRGLISQSTIHSTIMLLLLLIGIRLITVGIGL